MHQSVMSLVATGSVANTVVVRVDFNESYYLFIILEEKEHLCLFVSNYKSDRSREKDAV